LKQINDDLKAEKQEQVPALKAQKATITKQQIEQRQKLAQQQEAQRIAQQESQKAEFRTGLGGLWDRLRGHTKKLEGKHAEEIKVVAMQKRQEKDVLIQEQLSQRREYSAEVQARKEAYLAKRQEVRTDIQTYREMRQPSPQLSLETALDPPQSMEARKQAYLEQRQAQNVPEQSQTPIQTPRPPKIGALNTLV